MERISSLTAACFFGDVVSFVRRNAINALRLFVCSSVALAHLALPAMKSEFHGPIYDNSTRRDIYAAPH